MSKVEELLEELVGLMKAQEGQFVYTSTANETTIENILNEYPLRYSKRSTLLADLTEYMINSRKEVFQEVQDRINQLGIKAYATYQRLPVSGTLGTINAVAEKAQIYGYNTGSASWQSIYSENNQLLTKVSNAYDSVNDRFKVSAKLELTSYSGVVVAGQTVAGATSTQLTANTDFALRLTIKSGKSNTGTVTVGSNSSEYLELGAGEEVILEKVNVNAVYIRGNGTDVVNWIYTR